ncbi:hypothetical protein MKW92_017489 [Papaver armeniacum]|nr:hypothetical protein MKW92_017489 [Papaver armeniacum]
MGTLELAEVAAKNIFEIEPDNAGNHALLSNIYAADSKWDKVAGSRIVGRRRKWERVGLILYTVYTFVAPDGNHPRIMEIYEKLDDLAAEMKMLNYKVENLEIESDLHDVEEEREDLLRHHSEKETLAFGLIALPFAVPIRIKKNLQICRDCHTFIMLASRISGRKIL